MSRRSHTTTLAGAPAWITEPGEQYRHVQDADGTVIHSDVMGGVTASPFEIVAYDVGDEAIGAALGDRATAWEPSQTLDAGDLRTHDGVVYAVIQPHTTQADWPPASVPALFRRLGPVGATGPQPWAQPQGAHDAYQTGDEVTHPDRANTMGEGASTVWVWRSKIPANTTEPGQDGQFHRWWEPVRAA